MPTSTEDVEDATNTCKPVVMKHFLVSWPGGLCGSIIISSRVSRSKFATIDAADIYSILVHITSTYVDVREIRKEERE